MLKIVGVSKEYGSVRALTNVSLDIAAGETIAIVGPSGSGKSTLLGCVAGYVRPTCGTVILDARDITNAPLRERNVGIVFQDYSLFSNLTVEENVVFPASARRARKNLGSLLRALFTLKHRDDMPTTAKLLEQLQIGRHARKVPDQLSGGERQRVAIARALMQRPAVLCLDEPLGALDQHLRSALQDELRSLAELLNCPVLYVTHDRQEAMTVATRVAVLRDGVIVQTAEPRHLYRAPATAFVASFVAGCNIVQAERLLRSEHGTVADLGGGIVLLSASEPLDGGVLAISPDDIYLREAEDRSSTVPGIVREVTFLGSTTKYIVQIANGVMLTCHAPGVNGLTAGMPCSLDIPPAVVRVVMDDLRVSAG